MPEKETLQRAAEDKRKGKAASTQAGEFIREEFHHIREGKHGARSSRQAVAIGLSKARRAGIELPPPKKGKVSEQVRRKSQRDYEVGQGIRPKRTSPKRSRVRREVSEREKPQAASHAALPRQTKKAGARRLPLERSASARKTARPRLNKSRISLEDHSF